MNSVIVGSVVSNQTRKLGISFLKPDHPFECVATGGVGIELRLFDLTFDSLDQNNSFSHELFFENIEKHEIILDQLRNQRSLYKNLTTCETLFRVSAIGLIRNCFHEDELERLVKDSVSCASITHGSFVSKIGSIMIALSVSYAFRNRNLQKLREFLIENLLSLRENGILENKSAFNMIISQLKDTFESKSGGISSILSGLKENRFLITNVIAALRILPLVKDYIQIVDEVFSNFYITEFFSTFLSFLYGAVKTEDKEIDRFSESLQRNESLGKFSEGLRKKLEKLNVFSSN